tara:strand:+ start:8336 stop:8554 length:219 start_codon:yes stop_codon:yes gene_type:complete
MNNIQILGIGVFLMGVVLLVFAYNATEAPVDQISDMLTGRYSDTTMLYIVAGIITMVGGGLAAVFGKPVLRS